MNNKQLGNSFEEVICNKLQRQGYWVHLLKDSASGQPFDILALGEQVLCLDAKHCDGKRFSLSNVRENQEIAFDYIEQVYNGVHQLGFVIGDTDHQYFLPYSQYKFLKSQNVVSIPLKELMKL